MSTAEILAELSRLTPSERDAVRSRLDDLDASEPPSAEEMKLIDERIADYRKNPGAALSLDEMIARLRPPA